jgi:hypothetical protein
MLAQPSGDWSVFKQIFVDHWDAFQHAHPLYQASYYDGLVAKMLNCGNPEQMGYLKMQVGHAHFPLGEQSTSWLSKAKVWAS